MKRIHFYWVSFLLCSFLLFGCLKSNSIPQRISIFPLTILHVNDTHSHLESVSIKIKLNDKKYYVKSGAYSRIYSYVKNVKKRRRNVLFLHAGDMVQGTIYFTLCKGKADIDVLNYMSIDASVLGNHEFDKGEKFLLTNILFQAKFPILSANVKSNLFKKIVKPFLIKRFGVEKVAIVGLTTPDTEAISSPGPDIKFEDTVQVARNVVNYLKAQGINKIVLLTHLGFEKDVQLAKEVEDIDVIVGGHSHTLLGNWEILGKTNTSPYPVVVYNNKKPILVVTSWEWGKVVGDLEVKFDSRGVLLPNSWNKSRCVMLISPKIKYKAQTGKKELITGKFYEVLVKQLANLNVLVMPEDKKVKNIIGKYSKIVEKQKQEIVAFLSRDLWHVRLPGDVVGGQKLEKGSLLAPVVAKSFLLKARQSGDADLALENAGAVRKSLKKGMVSLADIYEVLPFGNTLTVISIRGKDLKNVLKKAVQCSLLEKKNTGSFPYLAGARLVFSAQRGLIDVELFKDGVWRKLEDDRVYKVATNSYLSGGGDFYKELKKSSKQDLGFLCADVFLEYLKQFKH